MNNNLLDRIMNENKVQSVGSGYIDCICPLDNIENFVNNIQNIGCKIDSFTIWEVVNENGLNRVGMGGPRNKFGSGWYSEVVDFYQTFHSIRQVMNELSKLSSVHNCDFVPGFWIHTRPIMSLSR